MFWFFGCEACRILALRPGIKPTSLALEREVLTTGPPGKSLQWIFNSWKIGRTTVVLINCFNNWSIVISSVQFSLSVMSDSLRPPWTAAGPASLSITNSWSPPKSTSIVSVMPSNHLILYRPLLLLPSIFPSIRVFSNESALRISWPKYWSFSFNISLSNEHPGLISFRMDWLDLLAVHNSEEEKLKFLHNLLPFLPL